MTRRSGRGGKAPGGGGAMGGTGRRRPYLGRIPVPTRPGQAITPKPKRSDRAAERQRLRRAARDPDES